MRHISFIVPPGQLAPSLLRDLAEWDSPSTLVLVLGPSEHLPPCLELSATMPKSTLIGASSDGTLLGGTVPPKNHFTLTIMRFNASQLVLEVADDDLEESLGGKLGPPLAKLPLNGIFLMAVGGPTLADLLIRAMNTHTQAPITGGLAATSLDGKGWIMAGPRILRKGALALGFLGQASFKSAVASGWEKDETVPGLRASGIKGNSIRLLNGIPAIKAIAKALGLGPKQLADLKQGKVHFPFAVGMHGKAMVLNNFDEETGEVLLSGDMDHSGQQIALLKSNPAKLVRATFRAAEEACKHASPGVVLFMVCNARREALGSRHQTELGAVAINMHPESDLIGWYSWGEVAMDDLGSRFQNLRGIVLSITEPVA